MPLVFTEEDLATMAKLRPAFGAGERFNPGKVFPGGAVHGSAYGISEEAFRATGPGGLQAFESDKRVDASLSPCNSVKV